MRRYKCCINISVSNIKMSVYQNLCMINSVKLSVYRSFESMLTHALLSFLFFSRGFIQIRFDLCDFCFVFVLWVANIIHQNLMLLIFPCQKISFLCKHNFFNDEKQTQWNLDAKAKVFHDSISCFMKYPWNYISWNALKENFHSVSLPL